MVRRVLSLLLALAAPCVVTGGPIAPPGVCETNGDPNTKCIARQDYIIVADNSDSIGDSYDAITDFMNRFVDILDYVPVARGSHS